MAPGCSSGQMFNYKDKLFVFPVDEGRKRKKYTDYSKVWVFSMVNGKASANVHICKGSELPEGEYKACQAGGRIILLHSTQSFWSSVFTFNMGLYSSVCSFTWQRITSSTNGPAVGTFQQTQRHSRSPLCPISLWCLLLVVLSSCSGKCTFSI